MTAFAKTGLVAVIDEVTGYQYDRERDELQKLLSAYISEELMPWTKRFPDTIEHKCLIFMIIKYIIKSIKQVK